MADLTPPDDRDLRSAIRILLEMLLLTNGLTGPFVHLYRYTFPPEFERQLEKWRELVARNIAELNEAVRQLQRLLVSESSINETSFEVARFLVNQASKGYQDELCFTQVAKALPDIQEELLELACFDLKQRGFLEFDDAMGHEVFLIYLQPVLFQTFDPIFHGNNPTADAVELAKLLLTDHQSISASELEKTSSWPRRRFKPALSLIAEVLPAGSYSRFVRDRHSLGAIDIGPEARACLERFITDNSCDR